MDVTDTTRTPPADRRLLRLPDVCARIGLGRSMVYSLAARGAFPQPVRLSERTTAWRADDIDAWIASRPTVTIRRGVGRD